MPPFASLQIKFRLRIIYWNIPPLEWQFHSVQFITMLIHQSVINTVKVDILHIMYAHVERRPFLIRMQIYELFSGYERFIRIITPTALSFYSSCHERHHGSGQKACGVTAGYFIKKKKDVSPLFL